MLHLDFWQGSQNASVFIAYISTVFLRKNISMYFENTTVLKLLGNPPKRFIRKDLKSLGPNNLLKLIS